MTDQELTRLAAEKVMGWHSPGCINAKFSRTPEFPWDPVDDWQPLTDWRAAGEIIEKMRALGFRFELEDRHRPSICFRAYFKSYDEFFLAIENTDRRAIVMAALRAVGAVEAMKEAEKLGA